MKREETGHGTSPQLGSAKSSAHVNLCTIFVERSSPDFFNNSGYNPVVRPSAWLLFRLI